VIAKGRKYRAHQRSNRVALCGPVGRNSRDGCGGPSSVVDLGRLCDLRSFVDWFCDMAQKSPMISHDAGSVMQRLVGTARRLLPPRLTRLA
jgi:hypothetical protein